MLTTKISDIQKPDCRTTYFNVTLTNNQQTSQPATTVVSLPADFLPPGKIIKAGIDRFTINSCSVPIQVFPDNTYFVSLSYNGITEKQPLVYSEVMDQGPNQIIPNSLFSYQQLALLINAALQLAFTALQTNGAVAPALNTTTAPFVIFNTDNQKYQIYADSAFYDETLPLPVTLYYNSVLYYNFNNYLIQFIGENTPDQRDVRIAIRNMGLDTNTKVFGGVTYFVMDQEYSNTSTITEPQLISIYSNTIGIKPELTVPTNTSANNGLVNVNFANGAIPFANQIADLAPNFSNADPSQWRSIISYVPFYRRMHDMSVKPDSKTIDLSVFWSNSQNVFFQFYIEPLGAMTIKFVFQYEN